MSDVEHAGYERTYRATLRPLVLLYILLLFPLVILRGLTAEDVKATGVYNDFDAFYLAGKMYWEGKLSQAYVVETFAQQIELDAGKQVIMPWTYPPQFNLITLLLATIERPFAYWIFIGVTGPLFFISMWALAKQWIVLPLALLLPNLIILVLSGQNGFLTAGLLATYILLMMQDRALAGLPLGLMVIKPHLAVGIAWLALLNRQWGIIFVAAFTVVLTSLLATAVLGLSIWDAFAGAVRESSERMSQGQYHLYRMTSAYTLIYSITNGNALLSTIIHALFAGVMMVAVSYGFAKGWPPKRCMAFACLATLTISPYCYDYDLAIFAVGLALISEELWTFSYRIEKLMLFATCWLMSGWGLGCVLIIGKGERIKLSEQPISLGGLGLILTCFLLWRILARITSSERQNA